jgi:hypothetical protein
MVKDLGPLKFVLIGTVSVLISTFVLSEIASAAPKLASKCSTVGQRITSGGQSLICAKKGTAAVWILAKPKLPNVVGMGLPHAETVLTLAKYSFDEHPLDGSMGIIVKENWIVCKEVAIGSGYVRLDVAKYGC